MYWRPLLFFNVCKTLNNFYLAVYDKNGVLWSMVSAGLSGYVGTKKLSPIAAQIVGKLLIEKLWLSRLMRFLKLRTLLEKVVKTRFKRQVLNWIKWFNTKKKWLPFYYSFLGTYKQTLANFKTVFEAAHISQYAAYRAVFQKKKVIWRICRVYKKHGYYWEKGTRIKTKYKIFLQAGRKLFWRGTRRYRLLRRRFMLKRRRMSRKFGFNMGKTRRRRRRRFYSLKSLSYKKYVPLGAFKRKFYKFPLSVMLLTSGLDKNLRAAIKTVLRQYPFLLRIFSVIRVPHNGIRGKKQRRV